MGAKKGIALQTILYSSTSVVRIESPQSLMYYITHKMQLCTGLLSPVRTKPILPCIFFIVSLCHFVSLCVFGYFCNRKISALCNICAMLLMR